MEYSNPPITSFRDLIVWQKGLLLVKEVYIITRKLPKEELFGLSSQLRRCAVSVPSNIAEGRGRNTRKDFVQFLHIARGSLAELETQLLLVRDMYTLSIDSCMVLLEEENRMLASMIGKLKQEMLQKPKSKKQIAVS